MKTLITTATLLVALLAGELAAQTVDINDYLILGRWSKWRFQQVENGVPQDDFRNVAVTSFDVVKNSVRYTVKLPDVGSIQFLFATFARDEAGQLVMHSMRVVDEQLSDFGDSAPLVFPDPIVIGDTASVLDQPPVVHEVHTTFDVKVKLGPVKKTVTVAVDGTLTVSLESTSNNVGTLLPAPNDLIPSGQLVVLRLLPLLTLSVDESGFSATAVIDDQIILHLAQGIGVVFLEDEPTGNFGARRLVRVILPGHTLGEFPPNDDITGFSIPIPEGVFTLDGKSDANTTGGAATNKLGEPSGSLQLSDVALEHRLNGKLILRAMASFAGPDAGVPEQIPVKLVGKSKFNSKKGVAKLTLAGVSNVGKHKLSTLAKPLLIKAKAEITQDSNQIELSFKSGKDATGTLQLAIAPGSGPSAVVTLDGLVDTQMEPPKVRPLGSEGTLSFGGVDYPISLIEKQKTPKLKEGQDPKPTKRVYQLKHTGFGTVVAAFKALSTDTGLTLTAFKSKFLGTRFRLLEPNTDLDYSDSFGD